MEKVDSIRLGIIGPGLIWQHAHEKVLHAMNDFFKIRAFCATSTATRDKIKQQYPEQPFYFDSNELLASPDIDAVLIMTPLHLNAKVVEAALKAGKIVFVEKPLCTTTAEAEMLCSLQRNTNLPVFVLEQAVYTSVIDELKKIIADGKIGEPLYFDLMSHFTIKEDIPLGGYEQTAWRQQANFPLGTLFDGGIHEIAQLSTLFGYPEQLCATGTKLRENFGEYDHIAIMFNYHGNLKGALSHSGFMPSNSFFNIYGTDATVAVDNERLSIRYRDKSEAVVECGSGNNQLMWEAFKQALQNDTPPLYTIKQAANDVQTLIAASESLSSNSSTSISIST